MPVGGQNQQAPSPSQVLTFWGTVGVVMTALKLKERYDEYRAVPSEEEALGPVALPRSPLLNPLDTGASGDGFIDTDIPGARPRRIKSKKDCCMCCGMNCGLFWKAFGIVCALFIGWNAIKLFMWAMTPAKTGLENIPQFSTSLGCANAPYLYNVDNTTYYVPVDPSVGDHEIEILGKAVGTLVIAQAEPNATEVKYELVLRTEQDGLWDSILLQYPTASDIQHGVAKSHLRLATTYDSSACMRYDIKVYVPNTVKSLSVQTRTVTHVKFDLDSTFNFESLSVSMHAMMNDGHLLLPHDGVRASNLIFDVQRGYLVGDVAITDRTILQTGSGDAVMNVHVLPVPSDVQSPVTAELHTTTGAGRADVFYVSSPGHVHRPISSTHRSTRGGDLYLTYKEAEFNGTVDLQAKGSTTMGVHGMTHSGGMMGELPWVGDKDGGDKIVAESQKGWIGLYF